MEDPSLFRMDWEVLAGVLAAIVVLSFFIRSCTNCTASRLNSVVNAHRFLIQRRIMRGFNRLGLIAITSLSIWLSTSSLATAQTMRAHFIDVGQGAATLVEFPCAAILIDTGGEANGDFDSTDSLMDYLESFFARRSDLKKTLHSLILTHPHIDHTRGVKNVLQKYRILNAVTNGQETGSGKSGQKALHMTVANGEASANPADNVGFEAVWLKGIPKGKGLTNNVIDPVNCGTVDPKITALWGSISDNPGWNASKFGNLNNHSVVIRIDFGKASMLVSGDLEDAAISSLITHYQNTKLLDVDVYQVGHHGSHNATTDQFLRALTPEIAVISMGPRDRETSWTAWAYGHPRKVIVDLLHKHVSKMRPSATVHVATAAKTFTPIALTRAIYGTGWDGTVALEADINGTWRVIAASPQPVLLNLNTAPAEELSTLPMIGHGRASAIVRYRNENGPFNAVDDLRKVQGIGAGTINAIRNLVRTN